MGHDQSLTAPIGVFDSGVGGLTVARALVDQLPHESLLYVGDNAHGPYGPQSAEQVRQYAVHLGDYLVSEGCKALVIACNTATACSLDLFQQRYSVPIVEVITPAVRRACATTRNGRIGVIATEGTVRSAAYERTFRQYSGDDLAVHSVACPRFVDFVERGITAGPEVLEVARSYVAPLREAGVDTLVLGCTHYPLLAGVLQMAMGDDVTLVSSSEETAKDLVRILSENGHLAPVGPMVSAQHRFETTGDPDVFASLAHRFLGPLVGNVDQAIQLIDV